MLRVLFCLMIAAGPVFAGPDRVAIHLGSHHAGATTEFEEMNPGLFLSWDRPHGVTVTVGAFRNSYGRGSVAATIAKTVFERNQTSAAVFTGLAHYPGNGSDIRHAVGDVVPLAGVQLRYRHVFMNIMPGDGDTVDAIFSFGVTLPLGNQ
ncbi:MAG: hypothetical protein HKN27_05365 [Silicimonas sp.]|nr:hypothetical protein [Silicimonas sp.]